MTSSLAFAPARVDVDHRADGTVRLRSPMALAPYARCVTEWLVRWAHEAPDRTFLAEREGSGWRRLSYADVLVSVRGLGQGLLDRGVSAASPVAILSENSVDHALLALAAMHVGIPVAPISPAYSLMSRDFARLKHVVGLLRPGLVWTADPERFAPALAALGATSTPLTELQGSPGDAVDVAHGAITPDTVAKLLFTSGSTGMPKGVINTHRMLTANQQMLAQGWPFVAARPPVLVDWLPWNHTFGGNHDFNLVLRNGGTLYVDGGRPAPGLIEQSVRNLAEIAPTMYFNVPRGFDLLLPYLEADAALRANFFRDLDMVFYAAAALPQSLWARLEAVARSEGRDDLAMLSAWGSTETSPLATQVHFPIPRAGVIGLPVAGCELKLVPSGGKLEVRVRGPHVTPGYLGEPALTAAAFDEEGFYRIGDAVKLADPDDPAKGIVFDGRVAEDFKLSSGTWVHVGAVRERLIVACAPLVQDAVITGHGRDGLGALVFLSPAATGMDPVAVGAQLAEALRAIATEGGGSSRCVSRVMVMTEPPSVDANEITDKGYINQRAVLERRADLVMRLYGGGEGVVVA